MAAGPGSVTSEPSTDPPRWSTEQVLALVSDASSQQGARALATPSRWREAGSRPPALWGLCQGSGAKPYQTCVDLAGPAYRCSCPSRKFPCKHALSLMLMWSAGRIEDAQPPDWVSEWLASRTARATAAPKAAPTPKVPDARTVQRREERVSAGLAELDRWLTDQVRQGITSRADYDHWDGMGARLVDSQAPGLASAVRRLAYVAGAPDRLLTEL
ncbi:MAG: SWIM zinc finger family protein, partial [Micromonosporaceae bacterium]